MGNLHLLNGSTADDRSLVQASFADVSDRSDLPAKIKQKKKTVSVGPHSRNVHRRMANLNGLCIDRKLLIRTHKQKTAAREPNTLGSAIHMLRAVSESLGCATAASLEASAKSSKVPRRRGWLLTPYQKLRLARCRLLRVVISSHPAHGYCPNNPKTSKRHEQGILKN